ncbi:7528_t:CDS:2, partial [Racocetra fulgida]
VAKFNFIFELASGFAYIQIDFSDQTTLAYAQKREGRCLAKVSPNTYLWACKKKHQWEASYKNMKQNYRWCNICL